MSTAFRCGFVVGKFAPLHRGHELVLRTAVDACERVIVVSYQRPELPGYPPEIREAWLRDVVPDADVLVLDDDRLRRLVATGPVHVPDNGADPVEDRRFCAWLCTDVIGTSVDAVFSSEDYGEPFAAELTRCFRERDPSAPEVRHVSVDRDRGTVPISGTRLRADPHANRRWLSPRVYASFVRRICLLGGESTGKTTLAAALAQRLGTVWVPEYGRQVWTDKRGVLDFEDLEHIGRTQVADEERATLTATRYVLCDTSPLTTWFYSLHLFGRATPALEELAGREYDLTVLCAPDIPFDQDGTRHGGSFREEQHAWYIEQLTTRGVPFAVVTGPLEDRVAQVRALLPPCDLPQGPWTGRSRR